MRTNAVIDDQLMKRALDLGGFKSKRAAIEEGLRLLVQINSQKRLRKYRGRVDWDGDLDRMRSD